MYQKKSFRVSKKIFLETIKKALVFINIRDRYQDSSIESRLWQLQIIIKIAGVGRNSKRIM